MLTFDHIAIAAETLDEGTAYVEETLGVALSEGGKHVHFGTHNKLLGLADGLYLEVIAIDPKAPKPSYPRWFDLDHFEGPPRITNWIARTADLKHALTHFDPGAGRPVALQRGDLRWQMAVPASGKLPLEGLHPALIEWAGDAHPAQRLPSSGCKLTSLHLYHPEAEHLNLSLASLLKESFIAFEISDRPAIKAVIETPNGKKVL